METQETNDAVNNEEQKVAGLQVSDLQQLAVIVDIACRKGVFSAAEAGPVGALYTKLMNFLAQFEKSSEQTTENTESDQKE